MNSILLLLVVVVRMSCCDAQTSNSALHLLDFNVTKTEPSHYTVGKPTTVTFSAHIQNTGLTNLTLTSRTVCVLFFDISTETNTSRNVGQVNLTLPEFPWVGHTHHLEQETVQITLPLDACTNGNLYGRRELCAGIKSDGGTTGTPYCVEFEDIDDGGVGEINCKEDPVSVPPYVIGLPVGLVLLLIAVVVFLLICRKCHRKSTDVQSSRMADLRQRFRSLPHIYADPSALGESEYDSTIPKNAGSSNVGYQVESETESPYSTNLSVAVGGEKTPRLADLLRKRPSQANEYTLEDSPFSAQSTMMEQSLDTVNTVRLEGVTEDDSATDRKSVAFTGLVVNSYETVVDVTPRSVEIKHSADFPQHAAPEPKLDLEPAKVPDLEQFPSRPCPVLDTNDNTHITHTLNQKSVPGVTSPFEQNPNHEQDPNLDPVPDQESDAFSITVPDIQSQSQESLSALTKPIPVPKPRKISMTGGNDPTVNCEVDPNKIEETVDYCDNPYLPPKPKLRINSLELQAAPPKPPVAKPRPLSFHNDQDNITPPRPPRPLPRTGSQTEITIDENTSDTKPKLKKKPIFSLPRSYTEKKANPSSKPVRPARKSTSDVDHGVLKDAIARTVQEQSKVRSLSEVKDPMALLAEDRKTNAQMPDPNDPDFLDAVMQNYLSLMYEMSRGEEEYDTTMKRELERIDSNTLNVEPQVEMRRKSLSAQLTLTLARKKNRDSEVYVNQWNRSWEFKRSNLEVDLNAPLGEGQFGKVYKGKATMYKGHECDMDVAVKVLKDDVGNDAKDEFLKELAIHTILKPNPHVVKLIGCCIRDDPIFIITEYLSGGNLLRYLRERPSHLTGRASVQHYVAKFGLQIARGMDYVANMKIVHRDLAARNILISEQEVCKVADFGFARDIFGLAYYPKSPDRAPIRWYAPEAILDDMFSTKSDVWSFGILLFEIATLGKVTPYHGMDNNQVRFSVSSASHPKRPNNCDDRLFKIMKICWAKDPENRPSFHELVVLFEGIQDSYPNPNQADIRPVHPSLHEEVNPEFNQMVNTDHHLEFSPDPQTADAIPSRPIPYPIPDIRVDPESMVDPDPHPEVNSDPNPEVNSDPRQEVNDNPYPNETDPEVPCTANTNLQPEIIANLQSEVNHFPQPEVDTHPDSELNPDSDPEVDRELLPDVVIDDVSPAESETEEEESF